MIDSENVYDHEVTCNYFISKMTGQMTIVCNCNGRPKDDDTMNPSNPDDLKDMHFEYEPYGEEWREEMRKFKKDELIEMIKRLHVKGKNE